MSNAASPKNALSNQLSQRIFAALPQTQCQRCGYDDCQAYAHAMAHEGAPINQCAPGGVEGIVRLSRITGQAVQALNPDNGIEGPRSVAVIDENWCIGCTLCLDVCPTDAIVGSNKLMHTVIEPHCTGCELCIPVCPVDCITLENVTGTQTGWAAWSEKQANMALKRYEIHSYRAIKNKDKANKITTKSALSQNPSETPDVAANPAHHAASKQAVIAAALSKARLKKAQNA